MVTVVPARERELLSVTDVMATYGVSRSFAYGLKRFIPSYRFGGVKFRRKDVEEYIDSTAQLPEEVNSSRLLAGMPLAQASDTSDDGQEVVPGITRGELRKKAGF